MSSHRAPLHRQSPLLKDFELDSVSVGPSARMLRLETDPQGGLYYQFARHQAQFLQLPRTHGSRKLALIDMVNTAALLDPETNQLVALVAFLAEGTRIVLMGKQWGQWMDEGLVIHQETNMPQTIRSWHSPLIVFDRKSLVAFEMQINIYNREIFRQGVATVFREGRVTHTLQLLFHYPPGVFQMARVLVNDTNTGKLLNITDLDQFPLLWPPEQRLSDEVMTRRAAQGPRRPVDPHADTQPDTPPDPHHPPRHASPRFEPRPAAQPFEPRPPASFPKDGRPLAANHRKPEVAPPPPPLPATEHLPVPALLETLAGEADPDRRWRIIEANLMQGRPERTYPLILNCAELIAERTVDWAPARLKAAFGMQPADMLGMILTRWHVNQILALADGHAESERLINYLRDREVERLLKLDTGQEPTSAEAARAILRVDRNADAAAVKKVWRTLLGFINADFGRREERPIHRKKDEVAKLLQAARNVLMRMG